MIRALARPLVLLLAALAAAPALWQALVTATLPLDVALLRMLLAVPLAALAVAGLEALVGGFGHAPGGGATGVDSGKPGGGVGVGARPPAPGGEVLPLLPVPPMRRSTDHVIDGEVIPQGGPGRP